MVYLLGRSRRRLFKLFILCLFILLLWTFFGFKMSVDEDDFDDFPHDLEYDIFIDETKKEHFHIPLDEEMIEDLMKSRGRSHKKGSVVEDPADPIILWWTEFTKEPGKARKCGERKCFFTNNRKYMTHDNMKVFMFYGTDFSARDLPLPRQSHHEWALLHEESPKNNLLLSHEDALTLFNHTSTFRRESDFPLSSQHLISLDWLEQKTYMKSASQKNSYLDKDNLSPVVFVQSDCDPPSDRDDYVKLLMKYISVDSYGQCLNNKHLPENNNKTRMSSRTMGLTTALKEMFSYWYNDDCGNADLPSVPIFPGQSLIMSFQKLSSPIEGMVHPDFYELLSHYKFAVAMENAVCKDYMTEKLWRPLMVGTVPIVFGSPNVRDFLPDTDNNSALLVNDFKSAEHLGLYLRHLNTNNMKYDKLRAWKNNGITNDYLRQVVSSRPWYPEDEKHWEPDHVNFVEAFECFVCKRVHENLEREVNGEPIVKRWANISHYGCPKRKKFDGNGKYVAEPGWLDFWTSDWDRQLKVAKALRECVMKKLPYCWDFIKDKVQRKDF